MGLDVTLKNISEYAANPNARRYARWLVFWMFGLDIRAVGRLCGCCMVGYSVTPIIGQNAYLVKNNRNAPNVGIPLGAVQVSRLNNSMQYP